MKLIIIITLLVSTLIAKDSSLYLICTDKELSLKNSALYSIHDTNLSSGLYCVNKISGKIVELRGGSVINWQEFKEEEFSTIVSIFNSGKRGLGYTRVEVFNISKGCSVLNNKIIFEYNYDMEVGLCGRKTLKIKKSFDINKIDFDIKNKLLKLDIIEQECLNGNIINKSLIFNISTEKFVN